MSVMIYDTAKGAFKDIQAMQRYDPSANAWKNCTSAKVQENGVWTDKMQKTIKPISISFTNASDISGFVCTESPTSGECITYDSNGAYVVVKGSGARSLSYKKNLEKIVIPLKSKCEIGFSLWLQPGSSACMGTASLALYNGDSPIIHAYIDDAWSSYDIQDNGVEVFGGQVYYKAQNPNGGGGVASADCKFVFDNGTLDAYFAGVKATKSYTSDIVIDSMVIGGRAYNSNRRIGYVRNFYIK